MKRTLLMLKMFNIKKLFCGAAIIAALLLCGVDFATSYGSSQKKRNIDIESSC
jgi:hypothetical protein